MNISEDIYTKIVSYLLGELDEDARKETEEWIASSQSNREAYRDIQKDILFVRYAHRGKNINANKSLEKVRKRLKTPSYRYLLHYSAAASVILLFVFSFLMITKSKYKEINTDEASPIIRPGEKKALLYLSSGEKLDISKDHKGIKEVNGTSIHIDDVKGVVYDKPQQQKVKKTVYNKIVVPRGGEYSVELSDGTVVWLNSESELRFPVNFTGKNRKVYFKGEGYFKVAHNTKKPFILNIDDFNLKVYGTEFNVNSYSGDRVETVLVKGSVGLGKTNSPEHYMLTPGQLGAMDMNTGNVEIKKVDVNIYTAWKNGDFVFVNETLEDIMSTLARWYDVNVFFQNLDCKDYRFSGDMKKYKNIEDFLFFLEKSSKVKFRIKGDNIIVQENY